jgi:uncharacterized protein
MRFSSSHAAPAHGAKPQNSLSHTLEEAIERAALLLPAQGPITAFVHHNTLHAFESRPFHEAVRKGAQVFGCQPYMPEGRYRDELLRGRIRFSELREVLEEDLGSRALEDEIPCFGSRLDLRLAMLQYPLRHGPTDELIWYVAEEDALRRVRDEVSSAVRAQMIAETRRWVMRDLRHGPDPLADSASKGTVTGRVPRSLAELVDRFGESTLESWSDDDWEGFTLQALWRVCKEGVRVLPSFTPPPPSPFRHRDLLLEATGEDADNLVNPLLIRFCAAFLDQGLGSWRLPRRDEGFLSAFCALHRQPLGPPDRWMKGLARELRRGDDEDVAPLELIRESLEILGVSPVEWEPFLGATLLALRGWGGMVRQVEVRGDRTVHPAPPGSLTELLAVRLILDRFALMFVGREAMGYTGPLSGLRAAALERAGELPAPSVEQRAFLVFQLAQLFGLSPDVLERLSPRGWARIVSEIESFNGLERRRIFQMAYERRFLTQTLDAVSLHIQSPAETPDRPRFQAVFCLDEREESIRRHLEELAPDVETFSTAGFFSVAMYYRGVADAHSVPLCPPVIRPQHWVVEQVVDSLKEDHARRAKTRRVLGMLQHRLNAGSRSLTGGAAIAAAIGVLASVPLVARTLFPRATGRMLRHVGRFVQAPRTTRLRLERTEPTPGPEGGHVGFSVDEMTAIADQVLRELGMTGPERFSPLVVVIGHGSTSMNNPHESAHDCGACGGSRGGPNARALAAMLNDGRIRSQLAGRGLVVPTTTAFVGSAHNTSNESLTFFDLDLLPATHREEFEEIRNVLQRACDRDAHERARRFWSAPLDLSFPEARQHVEGRAEDLAQVRPEWGHATNAISIVGRRALTRGLFLDRRSFLTSYDPTRDDEESTVLTRILSAVFPICAGINLEYYFSYVDNTGWGCGTKLPHNITSLLGVMDGAASDLRTGLPWQMVEIHEPVRLLFIIETTPEAMLGIIERNPGIGRLCRNDWLHLAVINPDSRGVSLFQAGEFHPYEPQASGLPRAPSSVDWYRGWRDHLEFAEIER